MGYSVPGAIGVALAKPEDKVAQSVAETQPVTETQPVATADTPKTEETQVQDSCVLTAESTNCSQDNADNAAANNSLYLYIKYNLFPQEDVAFIDTVEVRLLSPHKVKIVVYEKGILGYITSEDEVTTSGDASGDSSGDLQLDSVSADASGVASGDAVQMLTYQYFDKDGIIVEESHSLVDTVPQVIGATEENLELYDTISFSSKTALKYLLELTQDLDKYDVQVDAVTVKEDGTITLTYREVTVSLGKNSDTAEKVERLAKILPQLTDRSGTIDLSDWAEDSSDIIFQEY